MEKSESIKNLAAALTKAQAEMSGAKKSANNPFFKSKFADLGEVIRCVKEPFENNGLSFMQFPVSADGFAGVNTIIMHESGEFISQDFMLKCAKNDPQGMGSAITYAKRYGLQGACGIPSEDDDGNAASSKGTPTIKPPTQAEAIEKLGQAVDSASMTAEFMKLPASLKKNQDIIDFCKQRKSELTK